MPIAPHAIPNEKRRLFEQRIAIHPLFRQMAARQGINLAGRWARGVEGMLLAALDRCAACAQPRSCCAWLARPPRGTGYPRFCPNARALEACRIMDPGAPAPRAVESPARAPGPPPSLAEMLKDPLIGQAMRADRKDTVHLLAILAGAPRRLIERLARPGAI